MKAITDKQLEALMLAAEQHVKSEPKGLCTRDANAYRRVRLAIKQIKRKFNK